MVLVSGGAGFIDSHIYKAIGFCIFAGRRLSGNGTVTLAITPVWCPFPPTSAAHCLAPYA